MPVKMAIATSMATILFTSLSSVRAHHRLGAVRWDLAATLAPGIVTRRPAGRRRCLRGAQGRRGWRCSSPSSSAGRRCACCATASRKPGRQLPGRLGQAAVGAGIGFVSGLLGAGGAFLSVPFMTWCNVPVRQAVGTSAALGFPIAAASTLGYVISGWRLAGGAARRRRLLLPAGARARRAGQREPGAAGRAHGAAHRRALAQAPVRRCCCSAWRRTMLHKAWAG